MSKTGTVNVFVSVEAQTHEYTVGSEEKVVVSGTSDYEKLKNKPRLNGVELIGDKSFEDVGLVALSNSELEKLLKM